IRREGRSALHEMVILETEHAMLRERDRLAENRRIGEVENELAFDVGVPGNLEQIALSEQGTGCRVELEESVHRAFSESHGDGGRADGKAGMRHARRRDDNSGQGERQGDEAAHRFALWGVAVEAGDGRSY